jgi:hypothetical protein
MNARGTTLAGPELTLNQGSGVNDVQEAERRGTVSRAWTSPRLKKYAERHIAEKEKKGKDMAVKKPGPAPKSTPKKRAPSEKGTGPQKK